MSQHLTTIGSTSFKGLLLGQEWVTLLFQCRAKVTREYSHNFFYWHATTCLKRYRHN